MKSFLINDGGNERVVVGGVVCMQLGSDVTPVHLSEVKGWTDERGEHMVK